jgi:hypothetical protein
MVLKCFFDNRYRYYLDHEILLFSSTIFFLLDVKGQSHEKVDELRVWGISLGPN